MKKINPKFIVILGVIFVSFSAILVKFSNAPSLIIATYRLGFTVLLLTPAIMTKRTKEIKSIDRKTLLLCILSGVFLTFHFVTWFSSIKYTSIASATVLVDTHPIFITIGSYFILKEKVSRKAFLSILITILGGIIISLGDSNLGSNAFYGDILAILGALFVSGYMLIGRIVRQKISGTTYTFLVYFSSTITLLILVMITQTPLYPYSIRELLIFFALSVFCTILGHSLFSWSLKYIQPTFVSTAILGEPVFATVWALIAFSQIPTAWNIMGGLIVITGIFSFMSTGKNIKLKRK